MSTINLASGQITPSDRLSIELIETSGTSAVIIRWPDKPTVCTPAAYDNVAATATRFLANSVIKLAALRRNR